MKLLFLYSGFLRLFSNTVQGIFLKEFKSLDPQTINILHYKSRRFFYQQRFPSTFKMRPADVLLALGVIFKLFRPSYQFKNNSGLFERFEIHGYLKASLNSGTLLC